MTLTGIFRSVSIRKLAAGLFRSGRLAVSGLAICTLVFSGLLAGVGRADSSGGVSIATANVPGAVMGLNSAAVTADGWYGIVAQYGGAAGASVEAFDLSNPGGGPVTALNLNPYDYPTNIQVDANDIVSFRATQWSAPDPITGAQVASEVLIFVQLDTVQNGLLQSGVANFDKDSIVTIPIPAVSGFPSGTVPVSIAVGNKGTVLYTNGDSVCTANAVQGRMSSVQILPDSSFVPLNSNSPSADFSAITAVTVDRATDIVSVTVNERKAGQNSFQIWFFQLDENSADSTYGK